jgi:hypothetical protein
MLGRREREFPSHRSEPAAFATKATDLDALRTAVVDAAGVGYGLWFSYLFALLYFAIAAGSVTHRDLLLENPVKLPFLNVELPLKAVFVLGPLVFLVVHAYVLLHFLLLAGKVGAFHTELQKQISGDEQEAQLRRQQLRRQLPSNIFVQFLAGPREVREGVVGFLLESVAWISLVAGPIGLLVLFQLQFLPYHSEWITWWQRRSPRSHLAMAAVAADCAWRNGPPHRERSPACEGGRLDPREPPASAACFYHRHLPWRVVGRKRADAAAAPDHIKGMAIAEF